MNRQSLTVQADAALAAAPREAGRVLQRKCGCGKNTAGGGECGACSRKEKSAQRQPSDPPRDPANVPGSAHRVLGSAGSPLDASTRSFFESRFGHDFSGVRVHTDARAQESARAVSALAYTVGRDIAFGAGQYAPASFEGRRLIAHELAHVVQQSAAGGASAAMSKGFTADDSASEREADAAADAALAGRSVARVSHAPASLQRKGGPYIKKVTVHLTPPESAELEWDGTPPAGAPGADSFKVSTGKGYSDPEDPRGTCTRTCCADAATQCDSPWNDPKKVGACCTYVGNSFWTGTPLKVHNTWKWWTPVEPYYGTRGIALHQHTDVTGQAIGHGCVRMEEANAKRIHDFSRGKLTNVTIDGKASPVDTTLCKANSCAPAATPTPGTGGTGTTPGPTGGSTGATQGGVGPVASAAPEAVPGLEGVMS